jgi:hypothetical protein
MRKIRAIIIKKLEAIKQNDISYFNITITLEMLDE